jgi:uncharacterized repeat protein (TIGR03803 family)
MVGLLAMLVGGLAQTQTVLAITPSGWVYSFGSGQQGPDCTPTLLGNDVWGYSQPGGPPGCGTIWRMDANHKGNYAWNIAYNFSGQPTDGDTPTGQMQLVGNLLYCMTTFGGPLNGGTIFTLNTNTFAESVVYNFTGGATNGFHPYGSLLTNGYTLYGATSEGGVSNRGTVFSYWLGVTEPNVSRFKLLHSFLGGTNDGAYPNGRLLLTGSTLYGLTSDGGAHNGGVLFQITTDGKDYTVSHHFAGAPGDGAQPQDGLAQSGSMFYGMTEYGGVSNKGTVFAYSIAFGSLAQNRYTLLHSFAGGPSEGSLPCGTVTVAGTNLYGMTLSGGGVNTGTVFQLHTDGTGYATLLTFSGSGSGLGSGASPFRSLANSGKYLYGVTYRGGSGSNGTVFQLDLDVSPKLFFQSDSGQLAVWALNSTGGCACANVMANTGTWALKAAGDINGDSIAELLFQDPGQNTALWLMNPDNTFRASVALGNTAPWEVRACADFDGSGRAQVIFQRPDGTVARWLMNADGTFNNSLVIGSAGTSWALRGACDLDGDGKADLLFQNTAGSVAVWTHNPDNSMHGQVLWSTGAWALHGTLDVDGDTIPDLIWQQADGHLAGWFMNSNLNSRACAAWGTSTANWKLKAAGR